MNRSQTGTNFPGAVVSVFLLVLVSSPFPLLGQTPGQRVPSRERVHAEYINNIMGGINEARTSWEERFEADDLDTLMISYSPDATVILPGEGPLYGRDAIRAYWEKALPGLGAIHTGLGDMDASGQMAMVVGSYSLERRQANGSIGRESGGLLTVFEQVGRDWLIRAQVFSGPGAG